MDINIQKRKLYCRMHPHGMCLRYVSGLNFNVSVEPRSSVLNRQMICRIVNKISFQTCDRQYCRVKQQSSFFQ